MDSRATPNAPYFARNMHVLVVDPDVLNLMYMTVLLQLSSYKVTPVDAARTALSMIMRKELAFDIVIAEVDVPEMDGFKLLQQIRLHGEIPVILMGSNVQGDMAGRALSLGACYFLKKPIKVNDLEGVWYHVFCKKLERRSNPTGKTESFSRLANGPTKPSHEAAAKTEEVDESGGDCQITYTKKGHTRRSVWTPELRGKFLAAVAELGEINAKPLEIQRLMNVPNLARHQIASHLQKYRKKAREAGAVIQNPLVFESVSRSPTPNLGNEQPLGRPNLWNSIGGQSASSSVMPTQDLNSGQYSCDTPYLPDDMGGQNTLVMPTWGSMNGQRFWNSLHLSDNMGGQNTSSVMPMKDFINEQCLLDSSLPNSVEGLNSNVGNSTMMPTPNLTNGEPQKLWDLPSSSNNMGGLFTNVGNSSYMPAHNFSYGQYQKHWGSSSLSNNMGGLNTNVRNSWTTPAQTFNHGQCHRKLGRSPYLSSYMGGPNTNTGNSMMAQKNSHDLTQELDCIMEETDSREMQEDELFTAWQELAPIMKEDYFFMSQEGSSQNPRDLNDVYMEPKRTELSDVPYNTEGSDEPNKRSKSMVGYVPSLERNSTDGAYVLNTKPNSAEGSDAPSSSKPQEQGHWVLDDVIELLGQDGRFNEWLKSTPCKF